MSEWRLRSVPPMINGELDQQCAELLVPPLGTQWTLPFELQMKNGEPERQHAELRTTKKLLEVGTHCSTGTLLVLR